MVVDVDHPSDETLKQPFRGKLVVLRRQELLAGFRRKSSQGFEVSQDQGQLSRHQVTVDHGRLGACTARRTYVRSMSRNLR
jgi:hypothetical protein